MDFFLVLGNFIGSIIYAISNGGITIKRRWDKQMPKPIFSLIYPKKMFKKKEIIKERRKFKYPSWWKVEENKVNYYLRFYPDEI